MGILIKFWRSRPRLPIFSQLSLSQTFRFGRGPNEDGEWEAISALLKTHREDFLRQNLDPREINEILKAIDYYSEYTGLSIRDIRNGLTGKATLCEIRLGKLAKKPRD